MDGPSTVEPEFPLVLAFARMAADHGWSLATLRSFCRQRQISDAERRRRWPRGVRSLGWQLNAYADLETLSDWTSNGSPSLYELIMRRFEANEPLKLSVKRLAVSDLLHPVDTVLRTIETARLFWRCRKVRPPGSSLAITVKTGMLVALYSAAVLVWLGDKPPAYRRLRPIVRFTEWILG